MEGSSKGDHVLGKPIISGKRSQRKLKTTVMDGTELVKEGSGSRQGKSHIQDTADNADEEELCDSLLFVDPFTEELELQLREAAIELNFDWRKIKRSKKYANIFKEMTPEMLKVRYLEMDERDKEVRINSNPGGPRKEDALEISDGSSSRKTDSDSSSKTRTDDDSIQLRRSARVVSSKKGSGVVTPKGASGVVTSKGAKGAGGNKVKNPKDWWTKAEEDHLRIAAREFNCSWAGIMKSRKYSKVFKHRNADLIRIKHGQLMQRDAKLGKGSDKNKPNLFVGQSSTMNNSDDSAVDPMLKALLDGNKLMGEILTKVTIAVEILQEKKEKEKEKEKEK